MPCTWNPAMTCITLTIAVHVPMSRRAAIQADVDNAQGIIPRLFLLESKYVLAMLDAELVWVNAALADLHSGELSWSEAWIKNFAYPPRRC